MSITDTFDNKSEEIISPSDITQKIDGFPETVAVTFSHKIIDIAVNQFRAEIIDNIYMSGVVPIYILNYRGCITGLYRTILGGPASSDCLKKSSQRSQKIHFLRSCGSLDKNIPAGHLVKPTAA